ncbi:response regulator transcription factor [Pelotomaculum propionicicum]|uniref:Stage 0 sporulation protein A homolog n=1 Tax=Pelotomaculum propionicicum TaxID=258475 RepID=A0A4Y7RLT2_9FIRM|nr:response regulator [Pelotomaculum propionicicum]NLI11567.1 response regulator [Peptococcaceae bacterium]TEB09700.1 Transcriptional regulatory protein BaeR [Pelotomaculum propionicicum]
MKTIYIVDDEANIRDLLKKYLVKEGFQAEAFSCAEDVLNAVRRVPPDLFVLDITMPGMDGLELCRTIRKSGDTPIIFVSARGEELDRVLGLELGADDYLAKPFSPRELLARIKNILRGTAAPPRGGIKYLKELAFHTEALKG